jgi:acetyl-CoA acyltransferase
MEVRIAGVGMTPFGKHIGSSLGDLARQAATLALSNAGLAIDSVDAVFFSNAAEGLLGGQECIRGEVAMRGTGLLGKAVINVENACASGSSAVHLAQMAIRSGQYECVLVIGAEKMMETEKPAVFQAMSAGTDLAELEDLRSRIGGAPDRTVFMDIYAASARRYMVEAQATLHDFAAVAVKNRTAAALNPMAQFRKPVTVEEVLAGREIIAPLTLAMCSPIGDGAAAIVLTSADFARKHGLSSNVRIAASVIKTGRAEIVGDNAATLASRAAFEMASLGPADIDVVELHDATASAELALYEDIGLCARGGGAEYLRSRATGLGATQAVNSSGGLLCRGHPIGATGVAQLVELTEQLQGRSGERQREGARTALAENGGGWIANDAAVAVVTILTR